MKQRTTNSQRNDQHAVLLRLPVKTHRKLVKRASEEQRSVSGHLRYLVERDLEEAA